KIHQQVGDPLDEFLRLRKAADVTRHTRILATELLEGRNVVRIGEEANVKHQIAFAGQAVTEAEAVHLDQNLARVPVKSRANGFAQLVHVEFSGIDRKSTRLNSSHSQIS